MKALQEKLQPRKSLHPDYLPKIDDGYYVQRELDGSLSIIADNLSTAKLVDAIVKHGKGKVVLKQNATNRLPLEVYKITSPLNIKRGGKIVQSVKTRGAMGLYFLAGERHPVFMQYNQLQRTLAQAELQKVTHTPSFGAFDNPASMMPFFKISRDTVKKLTAAKHLTTEDFDSSGSLKVADVLYDNSKGYTSLRYVVAFSKPYGVAVAPSQIPEAVFEQDKSIREKKYFREIAQKDSILVVMKNHQTGAYTARFFDLDAAKQIIRFYDRRERAVIKQSGKSDKISYHLILRELAAKIRYKN